MTDDRRWRLSITAILIIGFGGLVAAAVGVALLIGLLGARENTRVLLRDKADLTISLVVSRIRERLDPVMQMARGTAERLSLSDLDLKDPGELDGYLFGVLMAMPQLSGITLVRANLTARRYDREEFRSHDEDMSARPTVRAAMEVARRDPRPSWTEPLWSPVTHRALIALRTPLYRRGEFRGLLAPTIAVHDLSAYADRLSRENGVVAFVLDGSDRVLAHPLMALGSVGGEPDQPLPALDSFLDPVLAALWRAPRQPLPFTRPLNGAQGHAIELGGRTYLFVWREVTDYGPKPWLVGVYIPSDRFTGELDRLRTMAILGAGVLAAALLFTAALGRRISHPIAALAEQARHLRHLALDRLRPLGTSRVRELDEASRAFDTMVAGLRWFETYVPRTLVRRLIDRGLEERSSERSITVMFTDIVGFTNLAAQLTAAECAELLNRHFALIGACIDATEGTIDKYVGDSVMAFWGAPEDQPDHARRAVAAARMIAAAVAAENTERRQAGQSPIRVRVGLHSGPAIVGNIGAPGRINYTIVGDTVNVAQRIEQVGKEVIAEAEIAVLMSETTRELVGPEVVTRDLGPRPLRGRDEPVDVHDLVL